MSESGAGSGSEGSGSGSGSGSESEYTDSEEDLEPCGVGRMRLKLHRATNIKDVQTGFGSQDPYVIATLLPARTSRQQSEVSSGGGSNPTWDEMLSLKADETADSLLLELWNSNFGADDPIDQVEVPIAAEGFGEGRQQWLDLAMGGRLSVSIACEVKYNAVAKHGVHVRCARELPPPFFGQMDAYVVATLLPNCAASVQTRVLHDCGTEPSWNQMLGLAHDDGSQQLQLQLFNSNSTVDDLIGTAVLDRNPESAGGSDADGDETEGNLRFGTGDEQWLTLDTGGKLLVRVQEGTRLQAGSAGGGAADGERALPIFDNEHAMLRIVAHEAQNLQDVQTFGAMAPYVTAKLAPGLHSTDRTAAIEGGGTTPTWAHGKDGGEMKHRMVLRRDPTARSVLIQVWNEGSVSDEVVGTATIPLDQAHEWTPEKEHRQWYDLEGGGRIKLSISMVIPVTEDYVSVGSICTRGPHWVRGDSDGGGKGSQGARGTIVGYKKADGTRDGRYPNKHPPLHAIVQWPDKDRLCLYPIGARGELSDGNLGRERYDLSMVTFLPPPTEREKAEMELAKAKLRAEKEEQERQRQEAALKMAREKADLEAAARKRELEERQERERIERELAAVKDEAERARKKAELEAAERARQERIRLEKLRQEAATTLQATARVLLARREARRQRQRRAAATRLQAIQRTWAAIALAKSKRVQRARWRRAKLLTSRAVGFIRKTKTMLELHERLATHLQAAWRGARVRQLNEQLLYRPTQLWRSMSHGSGNGGKDKSKSSGGCACGGLCVEVQHGHALQNTQMFSQQDPYVRVTLLMQRRTGDGTEWEDIPEDDMPSAETLAHERGGTEPSWRRTHNNQLVLPFVPEDKRHRIGARRSWPRCRGLRLEVWNKNIFSDDLIGRKDVEIGVQDDDDAIPRAALVAAEARLRAPLRHGYALHTLLEPAGSIEVQVFLTTRDEAKDGAVRTTGATAPGGGAAGGGISMLLVEIHQAHDLLNTQMFGDQDPFVVATLLPGQSSTARTMWVDGGGTEPRFGPAEGSILALSPDSQEQAIRLEVWNDNTALDDLLGVAEVRLDELQGVGMKEVFSLGDPAGQGDVVATVSAIPGGYKWPALQLVPGYETLSAEQATASSASGDGKGKKKGKGTAGGAGLLVVEVHSCRGLQDTSGIFSSQHPFVLGTLLPKRVAKSKTCRVDNGGVNPRWSGASANKLAFRYGSGDKSLLLEVMSGDAHIGQVELKLSRAELQPAQSGRRQEFKLGSGGGDIVVTVHRSER